MKYPYPPPSQSCIWTTLNTFTSNKFKLKIKCTQRKHEVTSCKHYWSFFFCSWQHSLRSESPGVTGCPPFTHKQFVILLEVVVKFLHIFPHKYAARLYTCRYRGYNLERSQIFGHELQLFIAPPLPRCSLAQSNHHRLHVFRRSPFPHEEVNHALRLDH